jgi:hypothetical protein
MKKTPAITLYPRVKAAADARGLTPETFIICMLQWHAPAGDNGEQQLRAKLKALVSEAATPTDAMDRIISLLGAI